jgi:hypothetical protein
MTKKDIIRMAHEAGFHKWYSDPERVYHFGCIENFAALVAAHERELCAKACEDAAASIWEFSSEEVKQTGRNVCTNLAAAIRARSEP